MFVDYGTNFGVEGKMKCLEPKCGKTISCSADRFALSNALQNYQKAARQLKEVESFLPEKDRTSVNLNIDEEVDRIQELLSDLRTDDLSQAGSSINPRTLPVPGQRFETFVSTSVAVQTSPIYLKVKKTAKDER